MCCRGIVTRLASAECSSIVLYNVAACCSVLQCVVLCCIALYYVAVCCSVLQCVAEASWQNPHLRHAHRACCSVLQRVAACCSALQCVVMCCSALYCVAVCCRVVVTWPAPAACSTSLLCRCFTKMQHTHNFVHNCECVAVCRSVLQCVAVWSNVLQRDAVGSRPDSQRAVVCCSVLQCVAACCSGIVSWLAAYCSVLQCVAAYCCGIVTWLTPAACSTSPLCWLVKITDKIVRPTWGGMAIMNYLNVCCDFIHMCHDSFKWIRLIHMCNDPSHLRHGNHELSEFVLWIYGVKSFMRSMTHSNESDSVICTMTRATCDMAIMNESVMTRSWMGVIWLILKF